MTEQSVVDVGAMVERLNRVERQYRNLKLVSSLVVAVGLGYLGFLQFTSKPVTVKKILLESQEVKLVDAEGNTRFFLRLYSKVPILQLIGSGGKPRLSLGLRFDETPFIDLSDKDGETRAVFELTEDDAPTLRLLDKQGQTTFQIN